MSAYPAFSFRTCRRRAALPAALPPSRPAGPLLAFPPRCIPAAVRCPRAAVPEVTDGARPFRPARSPCPEGPGCACAPRGGATRRGRRCKGRGEVAGPPSRPGAGGAACPGLGGRGETVCGAQVRGAARGLVRALGARPSGDRWGGGCGGASDGRGRAGRVARP